MYKTRFDSQRMILNILFKKIIFQNTLLAHETPPLMASSILNFHFCFWNPSLIPVAEHFKLVKNGVSFETNSNHSNIISGLNTNKYLN